MRSLVVAVFIFFIFSNSYAQNFCPGEIMTGPFDEKTAFCPEEQLAKKKESVNRTIKNLKKNLQIRNNYQKDEQNRYQSELENNIPAQNVDAQKALEAYNDYKNSKKQKENIEVYQRDIWAKIQDNYFSGKNKNLDFNILNQFVDNNKSKILYSDKYLYFFISSSIPIKELEKYASFFKNNKNVVFVLNGVIDNSDKLMPTIKWLSQIICGKPVDFANMPECDDRVVVDINPNLFKKFNIDKVPALVYLPNPEVLNLNQNLKDSDYYVFFGGVSPVFALEKILLARPDDKTLISIKESLQDKFF